MKSSKTLKIVSLRNYKHGKCLQYAAKEKVQVSIENLKSNNKNQTYHLIIQNINLVYCETQRGIVTYV